MIQYFKNHKEHRMKINCEYCGLEIDRKPSQIKRAKHTTCSKKCATELAKKLNKDIRKCVYCHTEFEVPSGSPKKFCSRSCSASFNNNRKKPNIPIKVCHHCGIEYQNSNEKFCTHKCSTDNVAKKSMEDYVSSWTAKPGSTIPKRYIILTKGYSCSECGISEWKGKPITLQLDHIDGNAYNNYEDNLRLLCPNCHSQTDTFGAKNKGNGRQLRREYRKKNYTDKGLPQY